MAFDPGTPASEAGRPQSPAGKAAIANPPAPAGPHLGRAPRRLPLGGAALRRRNAGLQALNAIGSALSSSLELPVILEQALHALLDVLGYSTANVLLLDWQTQELEVYASRRKGDRAEFTFRRFDLLSLQRDGASAAGIVTGTLAQSAQRPHTRLLASPIRARGRALGLLTADPLDSRAGKLPQGLGREHRLLDRVGLQIGAAVENARLHERIRREADQLAAVNAVGSAIRRSLRVPKLLDEALRQVLAVTDLDFGVVFLAVAEPGTWPIAARSGISKALAIRLRESGAVPGDLPGPWAWPHQAAISEDVAGEPYRHRGRTVHCLMHIPLRASDQLLGILTVGSYSQHHFAPGAADLLGGMANQISLAMENARLYEETQASSHRLEAINAQLAEANAALHEAVRGRDLFLANVTHELKRPLAPARLVLEALLDAPPGKIPPQRQEKLLRNALRNLDDMSALVSELLDAVRLQHREEPSVETFDLRPVAERSLAAMRPLAEAGCLQVRSIISSRAIKVRGDPEALARVVTNLLSNAIKFNRKGGSVLLQLERVGDSQGVLSVTDTGVGIPALARPHIFEHFYQADSSSTRAHEGLGLGLFIAREIVERHGGQIRFDTEEGEGTTFTVTLPLA